MKLSVEYHLDAIAVLKIKGALKHASALAEFRQQAQRLYRDGVVALAIDLSKSTGVNMAGLAALVEFAGTTSELHVAYCGLQDKVLRKLQAAGLDRGLWIYANIEDALESDAFKRVCLRYKTAVILCNGNAVAPPSFFDPVPTPMLDILGSPLIERVKTHLQSFGLQDIIANPGHQGRQVTGYFQTSGKPCQKLRFSNENAGHLGKWGADFLGSAGSLLKIQQEQSAFSGDFLATRADTLSDMDFDALMSHHQTQHADVTIAIAVASKKQNANRTQPASSVKRSLHIPRSVEGTELRLGAAQAACAFVMSPRVFDMIPVQPHWDIEADLLPALSAAGARLSAFRSPARCIQVEARTDYAEVLRQCLDGRLDRLLVNSGGVPSALSSPRAAISNKAHVSAQSYVGPNANVGAGVTLQGACVIGEGAQISGPSVLENCVVFAGTKIAPGFWAQDMTIHNDWAFDHRFASQPQPLVPMHELQTSDVAALPVRKSA